MKRARYRSNAAKNNASQTLYEQERNRLLAYSFPKDGPLHLEMFMQLEALFVLALEIGGPDLKASRANCLLSGSYLIRPDVCGHDEYLMQNARRKMQRLASSGTLTKALAGYEDKRYEGFRAFDIVEDKPVLRERCVERYAAYLDFIQTPDAPAKSPVFARAGERYRYYAKPEASATDAPGRLIDATVRIPARVPDAVFTELPALPETSRPPIEVTLDELIAAADTVAEKSGADRSYYAAVLRNIQEKGLLKQMNVEASGQAAESVVFDKVTSLVGLVGAGKSVLVDMLTVALAHRGCKTLMMLNSVADVMAAVDFFRSLGLSTSPLVSRNARLDRLGELFAQGDDMLLPESMAHYLETPCLIDGLASGSDEACSYGDTPCFSLRAADGRKLHVCPYWGVCPLQAMARDALTSDIVVTTPAGFAMMTVGPDRLPFFEAALRRFDVMFVDEVDRVQVQLDTLFAPEIDFQQFIRDSADYVSKCMKRSSD